MCKCNYFLLFIKIKIYSTSNIFSQLSLSNVFQTSKSTWFVNFIRTYIFFSPSDFSNSPNHFCFSTNRIAFVGYTNSTIFHWPNYLPSDCTSEHYLCLFSFTIPWPNKFIQSLALFHYRSGIRYQESLWPKLGDIWDPDGESSETSPAIPRCADHRTVQAVHGWVLHLQTVYLWRVVPSDQSQPV